MKAVERRAEIRGKDLVKGVDYYLGFDFYGHGNTKVRLVKFTKEDGRKVAILKSEDGKLFWLDLYYVVFKEPYTPVKQQEEN